MQITKVCQFCDNEYETKDANRMFCNLKCYNNSMKKTYTKMCDWCNKEFTLRQKNSTQHFCSNACKAKNIAIVLKKNEVKIIIKICDFCKNEFKAKSENILYCSTSCIKQANISNVSILLNEENDLYTYKCIHCSNEFKSKKKNKKFCSHNCWILSRKRSVVNNCLYCLKDFEVAYRFRKQKYCDQKCMGEYKKKITKHITICAWCEKEFEQSEKKKYQKVYCSKACEVLKLREGNQEYVTNTCKKCNKKFSVKYTNKTKIFCSRTCATSGSNNAMYGKCGVDSHFYGLEPWNKGLTTETDERLARLGEKISVIIADKIVNNEFNHPIGFITGWFNSKKNNKDYYYRSSYELKAYEKLEKDENVISFIGSPLRIPYIFENGKHNYIPDILVTYIDERKELVEIKPISILKQKHKKLEAKLKALLAYCSQNTYIPIIWTETDLGITTKYNK